MVVTVSTWELSMPGSRSLKEKRAVLRSLKDRLRRKNVSVAESGLHDVRNRGRITVAFLAAHSAQADSILMSVDRLIAGARGAVVVENSTERF